MLKFGASKVTDFIEIDFLEVGETGSGDAIAIRHRWNDSDDIYVVDGGYADDGRKLVDHICRYYGNPFVIDHVVLTHPDADHASGLETVLREFVVGTLWMNRPWRHVDALMPMFERYQNRDQLISRLKRDFPKVAELEQFANNRRIEVRDAFQGDTIGAFAVLAPRRTTYLQLIVESDKTPVPARWAEALFGESMSAAQWGHENLKGDSDGTSAENETSIVQFADVCGTRVLLTGDAGVRALVEAAWEAHRIGELATPIDWFQVPHHGSRRNLSSEVLEVWLGQKLPAPVPNPAVYAVISANQKDPEHPKKAAVRALIHRGRCVLQPSVVALN